MTPLLAVSLAALALAPLLYEGSRRFPLSAPAMQAFILASVGGLAVFILLPEAVEHHGAWALALALVGLVVVTLAERIPSIGDRGAHGMAVPIALVGLVLHTALDGLAMSTGETHLGFAVVLHRLPVAIALWWMVRPRYGLFPAIAVLVVAGLGTVVGFSSGAVLLEPLGESIHLFIAFVTGTLFHVVAHSSDDHYHDDAHAGHDHHGHDHHGHAHNHDHHDAHAGHDHHGHAHHENVEAHHDHTQHEHEHTHHDREAVDCCDDHGGAAKKTVAMRASELFGFCVGAFAVFSTIHDHTEHNAIGAYAQRFLDLTLDAAPALVIGYLLAGFVSVLLPETSLRWLRSPSRLSQAVRGTIFGAPLPVCSCGVVPVYVGLAQRGAPPAAALAFLVATPEIGIESILLSVPLLGSELTIARLLASLVVALVVGLVVGAGVERLKVRPPSASAAPTPPMLARIRRALEVGFGEIVEDTAAWIVAGLAVAAAIDTSSLEGIAAALPFGFDIVLAALLGAPLYVCASGATPLAAALLVAGVSPGACITFLLAGPATNVTTLGALTSLHGKKAAFRFAATVVGSAIALGFITNAVLSEAGPIAADHLGGHEHGVVSIVAFGVLVTVLAANLWRLGPVGFLHPVLHASGHHHDDDPLHAH